MSARRTAQRRSPVLTVTAGAVVLTLFGTGTAVAGSLITSARIKDGTVRSIDVRNGSLRGADVRNGSLGNADVGVYFAQVWSDGTLDNSSGGVTATKLPGTGTYSVDFGRDVSDCAFTGTIGESYGGSSVGVVGHASDRSGEPDAVYVGTQDLVGTPTNLPFQLVVVC